jgi:peptide chain release factor 3
MVLAESAPHEEALSREVARRRTFAIISHPDAGKTTLTEKLLLYTGAVDLAGAVRARGRQQHATSDWMSMERERGISVTASALEMEYEGFHINLLDTPGHQDFSEDTYRTLMAVDSAVMVLDSAKGIEAQTEKLFRVCRMRGIPILTFINKLDHPGRDPLELLDEIERTLDIHAVPLNWPIGEGSAFQGVYDIEGRRVLRYQRTEHGSRQAPSHVSGLDDPALKQMLGEYAYNHLKEQVELISGAEAPFDRGSFLAGMVTPVFFGSALNNFGVEPFLRALLELAPSPTTRDSAGKLVEADAPYFSGFVFKIQANMDPKHRDRMAFVRICSGKFERDMTAQNARTGKAIRLSRVYRIFGRERELIDEAYAGDIVGVINPGVFRIGDTVSEGGSIRYAPIPRFAPERFARLINRDIGRYKQFNRGIEQLDEEGAVQVLYPTGNARREPVLAVVGELQFDVVLARLRDEYGVSASMEQLPQGLARWIESSIQGTPSLSGRFAGRLYLDRAGEPVVLCASSWELQLFLDENPGLKLRDTSDASQP